jgi:hypothetical protein
MADSFTFLALTHYSTIAYRAHTNAIPFAGPLLPYHTTIVIVFIEYQLLLL